MNALLTTKELELNQLLDQASAINKQFHEIDGQIYRLRQDQERLEVWMSRVQNEIHALEQEAA